MKRLASSVWSTAKPCSSPSWRIASTPVSIDGCRKPVVRENTSTLLGALLPPPPSPPPQATASATRPLSARIVRVVRICRFNTRGAGPVKAVRPRGRKSRRERRGGTERPPTTRQSASTSLTAPGAVNETSGASFRWRSVSRRRRGFMRREPCCCELTLRPGVLPGDDRDGSSTRPCRSARCGASRDDPAGLRPRLLAPGRGARLDVAARRRGARRRQRSAGAGSSTSPSSPTSSAATPRPGPLLPTNVVAGAAQRRRRRRARPTCSPACSPATSSPRGASASRPPDDRLGDGRARRSAPTATTSCSTA